MSYFTWRDLPPEQRPQIPADEELEARRKAKLGAAATEAARPIMAQSDYAALEGLMTTVKQLGISELTIRRNDVAVTLKDSAANAVAAAPLPTTSAAAPVAPVDEVAAAASPATISEDKPTSNATNHPTIEAPLTGTFYRSSGVNKPALVEEGGTVKAGEAFCIIEAMKLFNQIKAEKPCKIIKFIAQHGKVVQKGTPIAIVEYL
jgi:acetyl-CoA carboxylase biotin carboxyl carrier protein